MPSSFNCCAIFSAWRPAIIYLLLLLTLGYWLVGPMAIWAAMCLVAYALCRQKDKQNWAMGLVAVKLAQWKTGALSDEGMRQFMASYGKLDHPINICMKSDLFFHLGLVNASRRYAFEFKQLIANGNQSGRMLKRLAETELVSGHEQLARKYLYILHDATFYRQWAEDVLPLTRSVKLLDAHPLYGPLSHSFPEKDVMY